VAIGVPVFHSVLERNASMSNEGRLQIFAQNWLPWQRPLSYRKNEGLIRDVQSDTYNL